MLQVTWPSATHSAGPPGGYLPVHRDCGRGEAMADDSAADDMLQIVNPLRIGTRRSHSALYVGSARNYPEGVFTHAETE